MVLGGAGGGRRSAGGSGVTRVAQVRNVWVHRETTTPGAGRAPGWRGVDLVVGETRWHVIPAHGPRRAEDVALYAELLAVGARDWP